MLQGRRDIINHLFPNFCYMFIYSYYNKGRDMRIFFDCPLLVLPILIQKDVVNLGEVFRKKMLGEFFLDRVLPLYEHISTLGHGLPKLGFQFSHSRGSNLGLLYLKLQLLDLVLESSHLVLGSFSSVLRG